jgi:hypothetical protein
VAEGGDTGQVTDDASRPTSLLRSGLDAVDSLWSWGRFAPKVLEQAILPGWTFAINNVNSSAPQTEAEIVARHSYGRQLGRIEDVLDLLLSTRDDLAGDKRVVAFGEMKKEIDEAKTKAAQDRLDQIRADLARLQKDAPDQYKEIRSALLREFGKPE